MLAKHCDGIIPQAGICRFIVSPDGHCDVSSIWSFTTNRIGLI